MPGFRRILPFPAGLVVGALAAASLPAAPPGSVAPPDLLQVGLPSREEGRAVIEQFREAGPAQPYYLDFNLIRLPRRGPEETYQGRLWGARDDKGALLRIELEPGGKGERRFLLHNGTGAEVWECDRQGGSFTPPRKVGLFTPLLTGLPVTPFDLEMPFLYWPDARLMSVTRIRGRPAHVFLFHPPPGADVPGSLLAVRAFLDSQYRAPIQTELIGRDQQILKTFSLLDLKKVDDEWLPKDLDVRDETTRDKGRFSVTGAALGLDLPLAVFTPERLGTAAPPPPAGRLVTF